MIASSSLCLATLLWPPKRKRKPPKRRRAWAGTFHGFALWRVSKRNAQNALATQHAKRTEFQNAKRNQNATRVSKRKTQSKRTKRKQNAKRNQNATRVSKRAAQWLLTIAIHDSDEPPVRKQAPHRASKRNQNADPSFKTQRETQSKRKAVKTQRSQNATQSKRKRANAASKRVSSPPISVPRASSSILFTCSLDFKCPSVAHFWQIMQRGSPSTI